MPSRTTVYPPKTSDRSLITTPPSFGANGKKKKHGRGCARCVRFSPPWPKKEAMTGFHGGLNDGSLEIPGSKR